MDRLTPGASSTARGSPRATRSGSSLCVAEEARGQGIGTRLLDEVDRELERRGVHDLRISVIAGNERAQRLYERRGSM